MVRACFAFADSGNKTRTTAKFQGIDDFKVDLDRLHPVLCESRVHKTPREIEHLRRAARLSAQVADGKKPASSLFFLHTRRRRFTIFVLCFLVSPRSRRTCL
jgi:hypothetical protein